MPVVTWLNHSTWKGIIPILFVTMFAASCSTTRQGPAPDVTVRSGYARSAPGEEGIPDFQNLRQSVRLVTGVAYYRQADFWTAPGLPVYQEKTHFWDEADSVSTFTESQSGTATIVQYSAGRLALITADHVVGFPDTVRSYHYQDGERLGLKAIAVRVRQDNFIADIEQARNLEILARDEQRDIAILGQSIDTETQSDISLEYPAGRVSDLDWGTHTYVSGFPAGMAMVTSGTVSQPDRHGGRSFLLDVVFNKGMSGAPIFARRGETDTYEWVGILTSGSASSEYLLVPGQDDAERSIETGEPFEGDAFASQVRRIRYGVAVAVSIDVIRELVVDQRSWLLAKGYTVDIEAE